MSAESDRTRGVTAAELQRLRAAVLVHYYLRTMDDHFMAMFRRLWVRTADRNIWQFRNRFCWDTDHRDASAIYAFLVANAKRDRQRVERARDGGNGKHA